MLSLVSPLGLYGEEIAEPKRGSAAIAASVG
jgi:hypothetical protein